MRGAKTGRKRKACMLAYAHYENDNRVKRVTSFLLEEGYDVDVLNLTDGCGEADDHPGLKIYKLQNRQPHEKRKIEYIIKILSFFAVSTVKLSGLYLKKGYDVLHVHSMPDFLVFACVLPKLFGAKVILDIHDMTTDMYCQKFDVHHSSLMIKILKFFQKLSISFADHVIVANHLWKDDLVALGFDPSKFTVILNTPDVSIFKPKGKDLKAIKNSCELIYHGYFSKLHGINVAINAVAILKKDIPHVIFDIYGDGHEKNNLLNLITDLNLEENVHLHHTLSMLKVKDKIMHADIGIVPKRPGIFSSKAFSTKILEYFAVGIPVIASKTLIDDFYFDTTNILFFEPDNSADLAGKIKTLHANPKQKESLVENAFHFLEAHSWGFYKNEYLSVIEKQKNV